LRRVSAIAAEIVDAVVVFIGILVYAAYVSDPWRIGAKFLA